MKNYLNFKKSAIATVLLLTLSNSVYSADLLGSNNRVSIGLQSAANATNGTAIGRNTTVTGNGMNGTALGFGSRSDNNSALAIQGGNASGSNSIAIGNSAKTSGFSSIAIGLFNNSSSHGSVALGSSNDALNFAAISIGRSNTASGYASSAIGSNNSVNSKNAIALGNNIAINEGFDDSVVLGSNSTVSTPNPVSSITIWGENIAVAGSKPISVVSVGAESSFDENGKQITGERQIINVAAGRISETSTDAVNGSQLYALADAIAKKSLNPSDVSNEVTNQLKTKLVAGNNITINEDGATNTFTISAKGEITNEQLQDIINQVNNIVDTNTQSVTKAGKGLTVDVADNAQSTKDYTVSVKIGDGLAFDENHNIVNDVKINSGKNVTVTGDAKIGYTIDSIQTTISGNNGVTVTTTENADGNKNYTVNVVGITTTTDDDKTIIRQNLTQAVGIKGDGKNIKTSTVGNGDVQVGLVNDLNVNSVTTGGVSISTNGINAGGKKVTNVGTGEITATSTDTVNGSQLYATNIQVHNNTQNISKLGDRVNHLDTKVNKVNKEARSGIAGTVATASLPQVYMAGKSMISAATGHYKNENAIAVGYSRANDNGKLVFKLNSSANTRGDFTVGTGIGYQW